MEYFPFFMEIGDAPCLVVGGGKVALRKIEKLLPFGAKITVVSPEFCPELAKIAGISRISRCFCPADLEGMRFVIGATNQDAVNQQIADGCRERNIPVNIVDDPQKCSFLFPALVKCGSLTVGISTGGASPLAAQYIRERVEEAVPLQFAEQLAFMAQLRKRAKERIPDAKKREALLREIFSLLLEQEGDMDIEIEKLLEERGYEK